MAISQYLESLKRLMSMDKANQDALVQEFVVNEYFKNCEFESKIDNLVFYLLNYALSLPDYINENLVKLFKDLFSHSEHCFFITNHNQHNCKLSSRLYASNWLKIYFESLCKLFNFNLSAMNDHLIEFMFILFKKTSNKQSINVELVISLNNLIQITVKGLAKKKPTTMSNEKKRKIILLIILILDGQFQTFLDKKIVQSASHFLDRNSIRMHWENLVEFKDVKQRVENMLNFYRTLIKSQNDMANTEINN